MRILPLIFLLLGLVSYAYTDTCPEESDLHPCSCEEDEDSGDLSVDCADEGLNIQSLKQSLNSLSGKKNIDLGLSDMELGTVPSNFFYGLDIKRIDMSHCTFDTLSDDGKPILLGLEESLEELSILGGFTEENQPASLKVGHLQKLKELDLSYNTITELSNDWFDRGPASLEFLMISNNGIEKVGNRAFANLINLQQLSFDGNRFGPLQRSMLPNPAARLEKLELDNNAFTAIPEDLFSNMPALKGVSLRSNGILRLEQRTWQPVWLQLNYVTLEGNPIECDSSLNWIFSMQKSPAVYGRCNSPREREGDDLRDLIDSRVRL